MRSPIFGPASVSRSTNLADNQLINLYPELVETKTGKDVGALYGCPGLTLLMTVGAGPIRAMHFGAQVGHLFVVSGTELYEITNFTQAPVLCGAIGGQGTAWSFDPNTRVMSQITLPYTVAPLAESQVVTVVDNRVTIGVFVGISAAEQDGFVMINSPQDNNIWQSDLLDLTTFDPLKFGQASGHSDNVVAVAQIHREMFVIEEFNTEVWVNVGTPGFAFQRVDGVFIEAGCRAPGSVAKVGETLMWLARNLEGGNVVVRLEGYSPRVVSTHHVTREFDSYPQVEDAVAYSYQQEGHQFYVLSFPSGDATWAYDVTESALAGIPMWHQRAAFDSGQFHRHWAAVSAYFGGTNAAGTMGLADQNVVGDYRNGNLYRYDMNALLDNGTQRKWLRTWRALPQPSEQPVRFNSLRIDMQTGIGVPDGTHPLCMLRWSDDGGHSWSDQRILEAGPPGYTAKRVKSNRLGSTRRNSGLDRIFELSSADQFPVAIVGAELEI